MFDILIIGGGIAAVSAALTARNRGKSVAVVSGSMESQSLYKAEKITNYPGVVPTSGGMPGLKAFVAAVFGGIGSIPGAVIGAFIIGICESLIKGLDTILLTRGIIMDQVGFATFSDAFTFVLLIIILVFKPTGLFGEKSTDKV